jgi:outer membrane receptor protein involved in Fe transport
MRKQLSAIFWLAGVSGISLALACTPAASQTAPSGKSYDIPRQSLGNALTAFAEQSGIEILFAPEVVRGKRAPALRGVYTSDQALAELLRGSGLVTRKGSGTTVLIERATLSSAAEDRTDLSSGGDDNGESPEQSIVVTGTRLKRQGFDAPTPVTEVTQQMLREGARPNVAAALNDLPQFKVTAGPQNNASSGTPGSTGVDLRGLGSNRTLTLLDGRRIVGPDGSQVAGSGFDLSLIPSSLVKRVDIVTGSASAAWGSGAVAGVVNVVLDDGFEGLRIGAQAGVSSRGDGGQQMVNGAFGTRFSGGRGSLIVGAEYAQDQGIFPRTARKNVGRWAVVSNPAFDPSDTSPGAAKALIIAPDVGYNLFSDGGLILSGVNAGRTFNPDGTLRQFNYGQPVGITSIGGDSPSFDDATYLSAPSKRYSAFGRLSFDFSPAIKLTAELLHARVFEQHAWFPEYNFGDLTISADNAFLSDTIRSQMANAGETSFSLGRFNSDFALSRVDYSRKLTQATLIADGKLGSSLTWQAYYSHGEYDYQFDISNQRIRANFLNALDSVQAPGTGTPVCRINADADPTNNDPACQPINIFGAGSPSQQARDYVLGTSMQDEKRVLDNGALVVRGEPFSLWAGPVSFAAGVEARREKLRVTAGSLDLARAFTLVNASPLSGRQSVKEAFGEVLIPLLRDVTLFQALDLNGAARISDYSNSGSIWSWKIGVINRVVDGFQLRFTRSRDIRAPGIGELYSPLIPGISNIIDPVRNEGYAVQTLTGANPLLQPEVSKTTTFGLSVTPAAFPRLRFSADYYDINVTNAISAVSAQDAVNRCFNGNSDLCRLVSRGADGRITLVTGSIANFVNLKVSGIDAAFEASLPLGDRIPGAIRLKTIVSYVDKFRTNDGTTSTDYVRSQGLYYVNGIPKIRVNASLYYETDSFQANLRARYISSGFYDKNTPDIQNNRIPSYTYFDFGVSTTIDSGSRQLELYANINNLLDKDPPPASSFSPYYDVVGRYLSVGARAKF